MSRRANPKIVGGFVLAAIALLVGGALVFGSFSFFEVTRTAVVFFAGSVDGLTQGSAVLFRGVPIGRVVDVGIRYDPQTNTLAIPVIIEIRPGVIAKYSPPGQTNVELLNSLIDHGLRARLESASLVTGQQVVAFNFFPGTRSISRRRICRIFRYPPYRRRRSRSCRRSMSRREICRR